MEGLEVQPHPLSDHRAWGDPADIGKLSVFLLIIQSVAHHEQVIDEKPGVIRGQGHSTPGLLVEKAARSDGSGAQRFHVINQPA